jgi:hypothetical protein
VKSGWKYVLNQTSVEVLLSARAAERSRLMQFLHSLAEDPGKHGDFNAQDDVGRTVQIKALGLFMITYWADHAVREVRVIRIERV